MYRPKAAQITGPGREIKMANNYLHDQQNKFESYTESYRKEANEVFRELVQQMILVGTVTLTVSAFVFNIQNLSSKLSDCYKILLLIAWILIAISLLCGIIQYVIDYFFFRDWTLAKASVVRGIYEKRINEENIGREVSELQRGVPDTSSTIPVWVEISTLVVGLFFLVIVMGHLLFAL